MKYVVAVIPPHHLNEVLDELYKREVRMVTVGQVMGYGQEKGEAEVYRGHTEVGRLLQKVKLEIAVRDDSVQEITNAITSRLDSEAEAGDSRGEIFVMGLLEDVVTGV